MDLTALQIFKSWYEHGGVNKAAAKLHRVPSNVTTRIKQLEEQLGAKLFSRVGRRLALSHEGKLLLPLPTSCCGFLPRQKPRCATRNPGERCGSGAGKYRGEPAAARPVPLSRALSGRPDRAGHRHFGRPGFPGAQAGRRSRIRRRTVQR